MSNVKLYDIQTTRSRSICIHTFCAAAAAASDNDDVNAFEYINFNAFSINASVQKAFCKLL